MKKKITLILLITGILFILSGIMFFKFFPRYIIKKYIHILADENNIKISYDSLNTKGICTDIHGLKVYFDDCTAKRPSMIYIEKINIVPDFLSVFKTRFRLKKVMISGIELRIKIYTI